MIGDINRNIRTGYTKVYGSYGFQRENEVADKIVFDLVVVYVAYKEKRITKYNNKKRRNYVLNRLLYGRVFRVIYELSSYYWL